MVLARIGARSGAGADVLVASTLVEARRLRGQHPGCAVVVASIQLPFRDAALTAIEDERARSFEAVAEAARALAPGGALRVMSPERESARFWKKKSKPIHRAEWSAWFLNAGLDAIAQREVDADLCTEGVARRRF